MNIDTYEGYTNHFRPLVSQMDAARDYCRRCAKRGIQPPLVRVMAVGQMPVYWAELAMSDVASERGEL